MTANRHPTTALVAVFMLAVSACTGPFYERPPPEKAEVINQTDDMIWLSHDEGIFLDVDGLATEYYCVGGPGHVNVHLADPATDPGTEPVFTLDMGDEDFCAGTYEWDGTTLSRTE